MTTKTIITILCLLFMFSSISKAQKTYYIKDSVKVLNPTIQANPKKNIEKWNPYFSLQIRIKDSIKLFSPNQIDEYKDDRGRIFRSYQIQDSENKVFLELLEDGFIKLYYLKDKNNSKRFFIKVNSELTELIQNSDSKKNNIAKILNSIWTQCDENKKITSAAKLNKKILKLLIRSHNKCEKIYTAEFKKSIALGINFIKPIVNFGTDTQTLVFEEIREAYNYTQKPTPYIEFGMSIPISKFSFTFETGIKGIYFSSNNEATKELSVPFFRDFSSKLNFIDLSIPLNIRYSSTGIRKRVYLSAGPAIHFFALNKEKNIQTTRRDNEIQDVKEVDESLKSLGIGLNTNVGIIIPIKNSKSIGLELGYTSRKTGKKSRILEFENYYLVAKIYF